MKLTGERLKYDALILFIYLFFLKNIFENKVPGLGYVDELVAASSILVLVYKGKFRNNATIWFVLGFLLVGAISTLIYHIQPIKAELQDIIVCVKMWLSIYVGSTIFAQFDIAKYAKKIYIHIKILTGIITIALVLDAIFDLWPVGKRYGLKVFFLFGANGSVMVSEYIMLVLIVLMIAPYVKGIYKELVILLLVMSLTLRAKAIGITLVAVYIVYKVIYKKERIRISNLIFIGAFVVLGASPLIYYYYFGPLVQESPRAQLTRVAMQIADDYFPLGSGYGSFASFFSGVYYSPLYEQYGISHVYGMTADNTSYLSDTCWPIIIGQFGWIGTLLFISALISLAIIVQKKSKYYFEPGKYAAGWLFLLACLINSTAEPAFFNSVIVGSSLCFGMAVSASKPKQDLEISEEI